MLTNSQMIAGRFLRWHKARTKIAAIRKQLAAGHQVTVWTCLRGTQYDRRHVDMFKACRNGAFVQSGRKWLCIDFNKITVR